MAARRCSSAVISERTTFCTEVWPETPAMAEASPRLQLVARGARDLGEEAFEVAAGRLRRVGGRLEAAQCIGAAGGQNAGNVHHDPLLRRSIVIEIIERARFIICRFAS